MSINKEFRLKVEGLMVGNIDRFVMYCETLNNKDTLMFKQWLVNTNEVTKGMRTLSLKYLNGTKAMDELNKGNTK